MVANKGDSMKDVFLFALRLDASLTEMQGDILCLAADSAKRERYRTAAARQAAQLSLTAQVLLRYAASRVMEIPMRQVRITYTENGKPQLHDGWHCSVSHTGDLCICAVSRRQVGLDAERERPFPEQVAEKYFSPEEKYFLRTAENKQRAFFQIWTKHESYVKLTGEGLRAIRRPIPPEIHTHTFHLMEEYTVSVSLFTDLS